MSPRAGLVVVCGDDGVALRAREELAALGVATLCVCTDPDGRAARAGRAAGAEVVVGTPREPSTWDAVPLERVTAIGLLDDGDLGNLDAALLAAERAPGTRVVVRLFDSALAGGVELLLGGRAVVLSATELAAPAFLQAALSGNAGQRLALGGRELEVAEVDAADPALVLVLAPADTPTDVFPRTVAPGERVLGLVAITTMATVGYGDINLLDEPAWLKLHDVGLMATTAVLLASFLAFVTDLLLSTRLDRALGRYPRPHADHVVVCGLGKAGTRILAGLHELGVPCVGIEQSEQAPGIALARSLEIPVVLADVRSSETRPTDFVRGDPTPHFRSPPARRSRSWAPAKRATACCASAEQGSVPSEHRRSGRGGARHRGTGAPSTWALVVLRPARFRSPAHSRGAARGRRSRGPGA